MGGAPGSTPPTPLVPAVTFDRLPGPGQMQDLASRSNFYFEGTKRTPEERKTTETVRLCRFVALVLIR